MRCHFFVALFTSLLWTQTIITKSQFLRILPVNRYKDPLRFQSLNRPLHFQHVRRDIHRQQRPLHIGTTIFPMLGLNTPRSMLHNSQLRHLSSLRPYLNPTPLNGFNPFVSKYSMLSDLNIFGPQEPLRMYHVRSKPKNLAYINPYLTRNTAFRQHLPLLRQPPASLGQPDPSLGQPVPSLRQPNPSLRQPNPSLRQPSPSFRHPAQSLRQPAPSLRQPAPSLRKPAPSLRKPAPSLRNPAPSLRQPSPPLNQVAPSFRHPAPSLRQPDPSLKRPVPILPQHVAHQLKIKEPVVLLQNEPNRNRLAVPNIQNLQLQLMNKFRNEHINIPSKGHLIPTRENVHFPTQETVLQKPPLNLENPNQNLKVPSNTGVHIDESSRTFQKTIASTSNPNFPIKLPITVNSPQVQNSVHKVQEALIQYPRSHGNGVKHALLPNTGKMQTWIQKPDTLGALSSNGDQFILKSATKRPVLIIDRPLPKMPILVKHSMTQISPFHTEIVSSAPNTRTKSSRDQIKGNISLVANPNIPKDIPHPVLISDIEKFVEKGVEETVSIQDTSYFENSKDSDTSQYSIPFKNNEKIVSSNLRNQSPESEEKQLSIPFPFHEDVIKSTESTILKETSPSAVTTQKHSAQINFQFRRTNYTDSKQTLESLRSPVITTLKYNSVQLNQNKNLEIPVNTTSILSKNLYNKNYLKNWERGVAPMIKIEKEIPRIIQNDSTTEVYPAYINQKHNSRVNQNHFPRVNQNHSSPGNQYFSRPTKSPFKGYAQSSTVATTTQISNVRVGTTGYSAYRKSNNEPHIFPEFGRRTPKSTSISTRTTIKPIYRQIPNRSKQNKEKLSHATEIITKVKDTFPSSTTPKSLYREAPTSITPTYAANNEQNQAVTTHRIKTNNRLTTRSNHFSPNNQNLSEPILPHTKLLSALNIASKLFGKKNADSIASDFNATKGIRDLLTKQQLSYKPAESSLATPYPPIFIKDSKSRLSSTSFKTLYPKFNNTRIPLQSYPSITQLDASTVRSTTHEQDDLQASDERSENSNMNDPYKHTESVRKDYKVPLFSTVFINQDGGFGNSKRLNESKEMVTFEPSALHTAESNLNNKYVTRIPEAKRKIKTNETTVFSKVTPTAKSNDEENEEIVKTVAVDEESVMIDSLRSMKSRMQEVMSKGIRHMMPVVMTMGSDVELSSECAFSLLRWIRGMKSMEQWAIKMVDASSKIPEGILYGTISTFGSYDECVAIGSESDSKVVMQGQYCSISMQPLLPQHDRHFTIKDAFINYPKLRKIFQDFKIDETTMAYYYILKHHVGLCVPAKCGIQDIANVAEKMEEEFKMNVTVDHCETATKVKLSHGQIISMSGVCIGLFTVVIATIFDWVLNRRCDSKPENHLAIKAAEKQISATRHFCSAFSAYLNSKRLLTTKLHSDNIPVIHGIKFLSISWIMLGHVYYCKDYLTIAGLSKVRDLGSNLAFQVILNSGFAADTFFVLSGLLVVYTTLKQLQKDGGFSIVSFYTKRYCRLTPAFLLASALIFLGPLAGSGPLWKETLRPFVSGCENYWWTNLFYFSNFIPTAQTCVPHGWYVSCDFQFYIVSPIIILALHRQPKLGMFLITLGVLISAAAVGILTFVLDLAPISLFSLPHPKDINEFLDTIGYKPYTHYAAYCIGMATGSFLVSNRRTKIPKLIQLLGWCVSTAICGCVVYGTWKWNSGDLPDWIITITYAATCRTAWSLGISWMVIACASGHGGIINDILSWRGFVPLSRLSYMAYLIHPLLMYVYASYVRTPFYFSQYVVVYLYFGHLCATFGLSFILSITFEIPFLNIEKVISNYLSPSRRVTRQTTIAHPSRRHFQHPDQPKVKDPVVLVRKLPERQDYL